MWSDAKGNQAGPYMHDGYSRMESKREKHKRAYLKKKMAENFPNQWTEMYIQIKKFKELQLGKSKDNHTNTHYSQTV